MCDIIIKKKRKGKKGFFFFVQNYLWKVEIKKNMTHIRTMCVYVARKTKKKSTLPLPP